MDRLLNRLFDKKPKKSPKHSPKRISLPIPPNVSAGPLRPREELDIGPDGEQLHPRLKDNSREDKELPAPEISTSGVAVGGTEHRSDPTRENPADTGEGEGKSRLAEALNVLEREYENTALTTTTILSVPKEAANESSPLGPLKAIIRTIAAGYANHQGTIAIGNKVEVLLSRIVALEERFDSRPDGVEELRRRDRLIRELGHIEGKLRLLSQKPEPGQPAKRVHDNEEVYGLFEDLREAIFDYQKVQQTAIHDQGRKLTKPAEADVLNGFPCAKGAEYRHGDRKGCMKGTRGAILDGIEAWTRDLEKPPVYWLNGLAGTGKSTIAQTIAGRIFAGGQLGASFFCSRDFEDRRNLKLIFPTIAVQLARNYAKFRSIFVPLVQLDPEIARESLYDQMDKLIVRPLKESDVSTVIVIDALDECKDEEPASIILSVLGQFISEIPKVKFFVTGRPEPRIREGFRLPLLAEAADVFVLHDVEPSLVNNDIRLFFKHGFLELARRQQELDEWPTEEQLDLLCERAAGLFVYAAATIKFVDHRNNDPKEQLDRLLRSPESSAREGKTRLKENTTLDSLYMSIIREAFGDDDPEDDDRIRSVLGAVILAANPLSPSTIATLLGLSTKNVFLRLSSVHSLLVLQDIDHPVRPFHKSFPDFIADPTRCIDRRYHVSPPNHHPELLAGCLKLMNQTLEKNMCNLPDAVANCEVKDLHERTERRLNPALQYACKSWHKHLIDEHTVRAPAITSALHRFLEKKFLFWLEVLSVLGAAREAVDALEVAAKLLEASPTLDLVNDCFRFVMRFFEIISTSSMHIYHSALVLCPRQSVIRSLYEPHARPLARIVHGLPNLWESNIAAMKFSSTIDTAAWSPCSRFIAISWGKQTEILDAVTLERVTTLHSPADETTRLVFSPDTRLLTQCGHRPSKCISWDLQTGGLISAIAAEEFSTGSMKYLSATYSACGTMFATIYRIYSTPTLSIYNILSSAHIYSRSVDGRPLDEIWTHGEYLRFATMESGSITTWEVGFASPHAPIRVESLLIPDDFDPSREYRFHPTSSQLAFTTEGSVFVWDARDSKFLLESTDVKGCRLASMTFSPDGRFFVCGAWNLGIYLWKQTPTGYTLHRKFISNTRASKPLVSPNGELIIALDGQAIQLWRIADSVTSLSDAPTLTLQRRDNVLILGFSPDEALAAITRMGDETITVVDLKSGIARLTIDAGMKVYAVGVAEGAIVAVGKGKIVTWNLPAVNDILNPRADDNDSVLSITFNHPPFHQWPTTSVSPDLHHIAMAELCENGMIHRLHLYDVLTGQCLTSVETEFYGHPRFTLDGREIWSVSPAYGIDGWKIIEDSESNTTRLEHLSGIQQPGRFPWRSSRGYEVTNSQWVLSPSGKRLLWLPPSWRSDEEDRMWSGRLLALLDHELPEPVILEFEE
ncbi:YVTN repeat-like/Quino protein amine dehydrogenase [Thelephora ganbajun]|uniref:YVTN repeat-like/Quino protein amine dehydrogenase n=1 Tax=Thelephora ganbajun TaxID=370292 RepID=A0ACB6ZAI2_THEGA|nr:YVTN repeat-like/Quino protein amine dehydrogenase [Thelephora ganbajun]